MTTAEYLYRQRWDEFPGPIRELAHENQIVRRVMEEYARGKFDTREEALTVMVRILARDVEEVRKNAVEAVDMLHRAKHAIADEVLAQYKPTR